MELYVGKRRNECWPHIFAIAEGAYQGMCNSGINQSILITGNLVLGRLRTPRRLSHTLLPSAPLARGRRERHLLRTKLFKPTLCSRLGAMPRLSEMTIHPALESSSESISINLENCPELTWLFICWKNLD